MDNLEQSFTLPYPPTVNTYWRNLPGGRVVLSKVAKLFRAAVSQALADQAMTPLGSARLGVVVRLAPPDRRTRDLDNVLKSVLDSLGHAGLYEDDGQIDRLYIERAPVVRGGRTTVTIGALA